MGQEQPLSDIHKVLGLKGSDTMSKTVILGCSSLKDYIDEAQRKVKTNYPVFYLNRLYHRDPKEMRDHIIHKLMTMDKDVDTILVAMGYCGGSWKGIKAPCRLVMPKIDECVSLLLQNTDEVKSNLREPGHLYVREKDPMKENFHSTFDKLTKNLDEDTKKRYHEDWKRYYHEIDIIDTKINDCRRADYVQSVKEDAAWLDAKLGFVDGGTYLLEKLFSGMWDEQFIILEAGESLSDEFNKDKKL